MKTIYLVIGVVIVIGVLYFGGFLDRFLPANLSSAMLLHNPQHPLVAPQRYPIMHDLPGIRNVAFVPPQRFPIYNDTANI
jgi:hypothetical protein